MAELRQVLDTLDLVNMYMASTLDQVCTCISSVDDELRGLKGPGLAQALPAHTHAAGVADLRLADHHGDGAAGNMATVLLDVHKVLPNLFRHKGDACTETRRGGGALQQRQRFPVRSRSSRVRTHRRVRFAASLTGRAPRGLTVW